MEELYKADKGIVQSYGRGIQGFQASVCKANSGQLKRLPRGSKYPIFKDSGPKYH